MPAYLAKVSYKEPTDINSNNYSDSDADNLNFFGRLQKSPECFEAFTGHMEAWTAWKTPWTKVFDTNKLLEGATLDGTTPFVVDVGGNTGIDISHVHNKHPDLPAGSLVLQDLPEVIVNAKVDSKIKAMAHDFFLPQPAKGKRDCHLNQEPNVQSIPLLTSRLQGAVRTSCTPFYTTGPTTRPRSCS